MPAIVLSLPVLVALLALLPLFPPPPAAQPKLEARQVAELADGLAQPHDAALSPDGKLLYVTDMRNSRIRVLEAMTLEPVGSFGEREFSNPHDVDAAPDGSIYVVDSGNDRVQVFDAELRHRASFGPALGLRGPKYLGFDGDRLWLADEYNHRILLLDRGGRALGVLGTGRRGRSASEFHKPEAVLARAPYVWVIDTYNDRVVLLRVD